MIVVLRHTLGVCVDVLERSYGRLWNIRYPASDLYPGHPEYGGPG
jgi:hypothetical protein